MELNFSNLSGQTAEENQEHVDARLAKVLILGSGPAGLAAALYAGRADLEPVVLTGMELGGQVSLTFAVDNYPGFPEGISGAELVERFQKQAERFGAKIEFDTATQVDLSKRPFKVQTYGATYLAETLIIASGATARHLEIPGEKELTGRGVSYCATCDAYFFKEKNVIVVGGGDSALEESLFLTRFVKSVSIVHRREEFRAGAVLQDAVKANPKIKFFLNSVLTEITGQEAVTGVRMKNVVTGEESQLPVDGVFVFVGHTPNTQLFEGQLEMDPAGYIESDLLMRTSVPGVFAAGEATDPHYRQVVTSAGMGAAAALRANNFLENASRAEKEEVSYA
jgi:thioredoxin reductase (NADPH)